MKMLGCDFDVIDQQGAVQWSEDWWTREKSGYITTVNVAILMMMRTDNFLTKFVENSALVVADGLPLIWLSKLLGTPLSERVAGIDLMQDLVCSAAKTGKRVYLFGAKPDTVQKVADRFMRENPDLILAGVDDGYYTKDQEGERVKKIYDSNADLLIVAMGVPRQERFLHDNWENLGVKLAILVGGSFDVIAGDIKRAPLWMQNSGMEWFYRLCQEPRRLFKRYLVTNTQFIWFGAVSVFKTRVLSNLMYRPVRELGKE